MRIIERHGDEPITIRTLNETAEREGWSLDTRLAFCDPETEEEMIVRGAAFLPGNFTEGDSRIELDTVPEDECYLTGPPCPECGREMRWIVSPAPGRANVKPRHDCPVCVDPE